MFLEARLGDVCTIDGARAVRYALSWRSRSWNSTPRGNCLGLFSSVRVSGTRTTWVWECSWKAFRPHEPWYHRNLRGMPLRVLGFFLLWALLWQFDWTGIYRCLISFTMGVESLRELISLHRSGFDQYSSSIITARLVKTPLLAATDSLAPNCIGQRWWRRSENGQYVPWKSSIKHGTCPFPPPIPPFTRCPPFPPSLYTSYLHFSS